MSMTFGERAVGLAFNPSGDDDVANCKKEYAAVVNRMHALRAQTREVEVARMASVAITEAQSAQIWAVRAIMWRPVAAVAS